MLDSRGFLHKIVFILRLSDENMYVQKESEDLFCHVFIGCAYLKFYSDVRDRFFEGS